MINYKLPLSGICVKPSFAPNQSFSASILRLLPGCADGVTPLIRAC